MSRPPALLPSSILARLRYRHLQLLDILGRTRNLRIAAEQMHMTQPAATKILSDIESMLGAPLFERLPREMRPTELGLLALRYANTALGELGRFVSEFTTLKNGGYGHITVGAISASAAQLVTAGISEIRRQRPQLVVKLFELSSDQLAIWLEEKKLDVMVGRSDRTASSGIIRLRGALSRTGLGGGRPASSVVAEAPGGAGRSRGMALDSLSASHRDQTIVRGNIHGRGHSRTGRHGGNAFNIFRIGALASH